MASHWLQHCTTEELAHPDLLFDGLAGILVVGVNAGSIDRGHPFDPDETPFMPHAYTVTLAK